LLIWRKLRNTFFGEEFNMSAEKQNLIRERIKGTISQVASGAALGWAKKDVVYVKLDSDNLWLAERRLGGLYIMRQLMRGA
jgi:hypothetical protein